MNKTFTNTSSFVKFAKLVFHKTFQLYATYMFMYPHVQCITDTCIIHVQWILINPPQFVFKECGGLTSLTD